MERTGKADCVSTQWAAIDNRRQRKPNGWQIHAERMKGKPLMPAGQSTWDLLLWKLGLKESELKQSPVIPVPVAEFARKHHEQLFVPVWALEKLGLKFSRFDI